MRNPPPDWLTDPSGIHQSRYWDGASWTDHVSDSGVASTDPMPRDLTRLRKTTYLGSHPRASGQVKGIDIVFTTKGIGFRGTSDLGQLVWNDVVELGADSREAFERRVTATRMLLLGAFAFVAPKSRTSAYVVIVDHAGQWMFEVPGLSSIELQAGLQPLQRYVTPMAPRSGDTKVPEAADRLRQLDDLLAQGLITEDEHSVRRRAIVDAL